MTDALAEEDLCGAMKPPDCHAETIGQVRGGNGVRNENGWIPFLEDAFRPAQIGERRLTEHGLEANQAADEAVEVDVHALVGVAHGDDVIQLVVEAES